MEVSGEDAWCLEVGCTGETRQELSCRFQGNGRDHLSTGEGPSLSWGTGPSQASPENGWQRWGSTGSSVCFAGIYSLKVFIFFWSRKVFYWMERILWLKIIQERSDSGNRISVAIPQGWWRRRGWSSWRPWGRRWGLSSAQGFWPMHSVWWWGRGSIPGTISDHGWWG